MDPTGSDSSFNSGGGGGGGGSPYSAPSSVGDGMLEPVETVTRDAYGQAKYEDKDVLEDDWEFQSDEEQYERDVAALKDGMAQDIDSLIRKGLPSDPAAGLAHAHRGGWSSPQHIPRAQAVASLPVKENMVYEITNLPLDDWGYFSFRVAKPNVRRMVVTLTRLRDDCDPCLFVRRGVRPTQTSYDKCTYQTWSASEREHKLEIDEVRVDTYHLGVWNTPIFGQHDAAFTLRVVLERAQKPKTWVDDAEQTSASLRALGPAFEVLQGKIDAEVAEFGAAIAEVRDSLVRAATEACEPGVAIAEQLGLTPAEIARRRLPEDPQRWVFSVPEVDSDDDGGLFGAMEGSP